MKYKVSLVLVLFLWMTILTPFIDGATPIKAVADVPDTWATKEVNEAIALQLVPVTLQSKYTTPITREEFCSLLLQVIQTKWGKNLEGIIADKALDLKVNPFTDTTSQTVLVANKLGLVNGKGNGLFVPSGSISRQEAAVMLTNTAKVMGVSVAAVEIPFLDSVDQGAWSKAAVNYVYLAGIMGGVSDYTFSFKANYSRQQAILTALRLYKQLNPKTQTAMKQQLVPEANAKLVLWIDTQAEQTFYEQAILAFKKLYPQVTFELKDMPYGTAAAQMKTLAPKGNGGDLFTASQDQVTSLVTNKLVLINDQVTKSKFYASAIYGAMDASGTLYGYPKSAETNVMYYNKDLISVVPKTFAEMITLAKTFNKPADGKYTLVWDIKSGYTNYIFLSGYSPKFFVENIKDIGSFLKDTSGFEKGMTAYKELKTSLYPVASKDTSYAIMLNSFVSKKAGMMINGTWAAKELNAAGVRYGVAPIPTLPNGVTPNTLADVRMNFVSKYSKYPNAAKLFAAFLTGKEMQSKQCELTEFAPVRPDAVATKEMQKVVIYQMKNTTSKWVDDYGLIYGGVVEPAFLKVWDGGDIKATVKTVVAQIKQLLGIS